MILAELQQHVYSQLSLRKHLAGRAVCDRIIRRAVRTLPAGVMCQSRPREMQRLAQQTVSDIVRHEHSIGCGIILTLILSALIGEIVKLLIAWWRASHEHQVLLRGYQVEMNSNG